jgi:hypothetical protein
MKNQKKFVQDLKVVNKKKKFVIIVTYTVNKKLKIFNCNV